MHLLQLIKMKLSHLDFCFVRHVDQDAVCCRCVIAAEDFDHENVSSGSCVCKCNIVFSEPCKCLSNVVGRTTAGLCFVTLSHMLSRLAAATCSHQGTFSFDHWQPPMLFSHVEVFVVLRTRFAAGVAGVFIVTIIFSCCLGVKGKVVVISSILLLAARFLCCWWWCPTHPASVFPVVAVK